jgi:sec-independent protein translocase protein TatB
MFDIAFSELILVALVALVVIGPERLPRVARMGGHLLGRLQRYVSDVKSDINREIQLEEIKKMQQEVETSARSLTSGVTQELTSMESTLNRSFTQDDAIGSAAETEEVEWPDEPAQAQPAEEAPQLELGFDNRQAASDKTP